MTTKLTKEEKTEINDDMKRKLINDKNCPVCNCKEECEHKQHLLLFWFNNMPLLAWNGEVMSEDDSDFFEHDEARQLRRSGFIMLPHAKIVAKKKRIVYCIVAKPKKVKRDKVKITQLKAPTLKKTPDFKLKSTVERVREQHTTNSKLIEISFEDAFDIEDEVEDNE